jgi:hypothetical protein
VTTATLNGNRATNLRVQIPKHGVGWVEATLDAPVALAGAVTVVLADLELACTVMSGGAANGRARYRLAFGAGGWGMVIPAKSYADDAGVKRSKVLLDAAEACGETFVDSDATPVRVGPSYVRESAPASRALNLLSPGAWYVDEAGVTRLGARASAPITVNHSFQEIDKANGSQVIAATSIASVLPGVVLDEYEAVDVVHTVDAEQGLRTTLWYTGITSSSVRLELWRELFEALDPRRRFRGTTEYRVVTLEGERLNLQPVLSSLGMPDLRRVVARPGVAGCKAEVALGARVGVSFMNSDPGRPYVSCFEDADGEGWRPDTIEIDATDTITIGDGADVVEVGGEETILSSLANNRFIRWGEMAVMPVGAGATPTLMVLTPAIGIAAVTVAKARSI